MYISVRVFPLSVLCFDLVFFPIVSRLWASSRSPLDVQGNNRVTELQLQTANCVWITFCFLDMIDMKKNGTHQELIIKSSFPALQVPEKDWYPHRACRCTAGCHGLPCRPRLDASYSIPDNWDQMLLWVEPGLGVTWKHLFYGEDV